MKPLKQGPITTSRASRQKRGEGARKVGGTTIQKTKQSNGEAKPKTSRRASQMSMVPIICQSCQQTDVPLIFGGRKYFLCQL